MKVFLHHVYEYHKGLRHLVLYTGPVSEQEGIESKLNKYGIAHVLQHLRKDRINVFFGATACVEIIRGFANRPLNEWTPEQDFILGIMLGYDRCRQCQRYLKRTFHHGDDGTADRGVSCKRICLQTDPQNSAPRGSKLPLVQPFSKTPA